MNDHCIELVNVTKTYRSGSNAGNNGKTALHDITLTIHQGEYIGLIGLNGSGKSTLARLLNGLIKPTTGKVKVNGMDTRSPKQLMEIRRLVGMVFQNPDNQIVCPVVEEEIAFGPENLGLDSDEIQKRIDWALHIVGLEELKSHAPHLLSGGQKQKLAIASVLVMLPDYLIMDEPSSMLDPLGRKELLEHLKILNKQKGITIIFISHNLEDLIQADRLVILDKGSIYLQGTPRDVFADEAKLATIGLEPPGLYRLINKLGEEGYDIDDNIKTVPDLVGAICQQ
jgi:energy-coupling factor transport system ATP-binding protein